MQDQRITAELQYRSLGDETYVSTIVVKLEGVPGYLKAIVEDVHVGLPPQPSSGERAWLLKE